MGDAEHLAATRLREALGKLTQVPEIALTDEQEDWLRDIKGETRDLTNEVEGDIARDRRAR